MTRQGIRSGLLLVSLLCFPVTLFYISPYTAVDGAMAGLVSGSLLLYAVQFTGALFVGRAFCGWVMPCGGLQEACLAANRRRARGGRLNWIKWGLWVPWLGALVYCFWRAGGIRGLDPLRMTKGGISVAEPGAYVAYFGVVGIMTGMALVFGRRALCHYMCLMAPSMIIGRKLRNFLRLPALQLTATGRQCVGCGKCTEACPMSLDVQALVRSGRLECAECILCGRCADACAQGVIRLSFGTPGAAGAPGQSTARPEN
jgi:ferredoxin-type protein NapH